MAEHGKQFLIDAETGQQQGPLGGSKGDVIFPEGIRGWSQVLDCRHTPYVDKPVDELRRFAQHVHKDYILVFESMLSA